VTIREFSYNQIHRNPYQPRLEPDPQKEADLLESVKKNGILQTPDGRLDPNNKDETQLRCGHRRLAAWHKAFPDKPFRIDIKELNDLQMSEGGIAENNDRNDLSAIEKMRAIARRMKDFGLNQLDAAAPFHLKTAAAVSNLMRLGHLPEKTQLLVHRRLLPERYARTLVAFSRIDPKAVDSIALKISEAKEDRDRVNLLDDFIRSFLRKHGRQILSYDTWPLSWPPNQAKLTPAPANAPKGAPAILLPCTGCPFLFDWKGFPTYCLRPPCFAAKEILWKEKENKKLARADAKQKIKARASSPSKFKKEKPDPKIAYAAEAERLIKIAAVPLAPAIPDFLVDLLHELFCGGYKDPKWKRAGLPERKRMLMAELLDESEIVPHQHYNVGKPIKTIAAIAALARKLRIRLPKGWSAAPAGEPKKSKKGKGK